MFSMISRSVIWFVLALFIYLNGAHLGHEYKHIADLDLQTHEHENDSHHNKECDDCNVFKQLSSIYAHENYLFDEKISNADLSTYLRNHNLLLTKYLFIRGPPTSS